MIVSHAAKYGGTKHAPEKAPAGRSMSGRAQSRVKKSGHIRKKRTAPDANENLWKKIVAWCTLVCTPCAAVLLVAFVWQMHGALEHLAARDNSKITQTAPAETDNYAAAGSAGAAKGRLNFVGIPSSGDKGHVKNRAYDTNLQFLHTGLIYSSFLVLIATICIVLLLVHFMMRDKHHRRNYQTLLVKTDTAVESRVRHRTAHLQAACHLAEKERQRAELLLQDTSHRVGNSLATVSSLLGLQLRQCQDEQVQKALLSARDRIQTISAAHRRLRLNKDMETASVGDFLSAVIHDVENGLTTGQRRRITIQTRFEHCFLPARDVTTLGIILGELLTNAVKHAFPNGRQGKISVSFGKFGSKFLRLIVKDDGIGLPPALLHGKIEQKPDQGLGRLIISQLATQFNAKPQFSNGRNGGSRIVIPLLNVRAENKKTEAER